MRKTVSARGKINGREAVAMHPDDARVRGIKDGDVVRVHNDRGACLAGAVLTDMILPGVAKLSCGAWYDPAGGDDGALCMHGNANVLTHDRGTSKLSQGPSTGTNMVRDRALDRAAAAGAGVRAAGRRAALIVMPCQRSGPKWPVR